MFTPSNHYLSNVEFKLKESWVIKNATNTLRKQETNANIRSRSDELYPRSKKINKLNSGVEFDKLHLFQFDRTLKTDL